MFALRQLDDARVAKTPEKIKTIKVVGVARTTVDTVLNRLELKKGSLYDAGKADRSLQALFATTQYKDVQITHAKGVVTVRVVETRWSQTDPSSAIRR